MENDADVLVVGAGPTGLALALWLARLGGRVRIIDKNDDVAPISRALGVHARTLEFYRQLGFAEQVVARGVIVPSVNLWARGRKVASVPFRNVGLGLTPFPFVLDLAQDEHERLLIDELGAAGVRVERRTELVGFTQDADGVDAVVRLPDGTDERHRCAYLAGCDGSHSTVRTTLGVDFGGGTYEHVFYVADISGRGAVVDDGVHVDLDDADLLAVFDMKGEGHARLVGTVRGDGAQSFDDVARRPLEQLHLEVDQVRWFSRYHVHHRVASRFRVGRAFLLGDAAHVHSPVGAQGMNTGIGDATNLAWKLAAALRGDAPATLVDSYEIERMAFARRLVATTDRAFAIATKSSRLAAFTRTRVFPLLVRIFGRMLPVRRYLFRTVSQILIAYRHSPLSKGKAGTVCGGDRLPWVEEADNYQPLQSLQWQVHVYGEARADVPVACERAGLAFHQFPWRSAMRAAGLARGAIYLVRPDGYVAFANAEANPVALTRWWARLRR